MTIIISSIIATVVTGSLMYAVLVAYYIGVNEGRKQVIKEDIIRLDSKN